MPCVRPPFFEEYQFSYRQSLRGGRVASPADVVDLRPIPENNYAWFKLARLPAFRVERWVAFGGNAEKSYK
jgi:hypothetical protein